MDRDKIEAEYQAGVGKAEISGKYGVSRRHIIRRLKGVTSSRNVTPSALANVTNVSNNRTQICDKDWAFPRPLR